MMFSDFFQLGPIPPNTMAGYYNYYLVALSYVVATLTSFVALEIASYLRKGITKTIFWPLIGGSFAMGAGIFSMHFIGMLAFIMPMSMGYEISLTLMSLLVAVIASGLALFIVRKPKISMPRLILGGCVIGLAIAGMHYLGMSAMNGVTITYLPGYFFLSVLIAISAGSAALWLMLQCDYGSSLRQNTFKAVSSLIMGAAICGMHYIGMVAAVFLPSGASMLSGPFSAISPENFSFLIACLTGLILVVGLYAIDQRLPLLLKLLFGYLIILLMMIPIAYSSLVNIETNTRAFTLITDVAFPKIVSLLETKAASAHIEEVAIDLEKNDTTLTWEQKKESLLTEIQKLKEHVQVYFEKDLQNPSPNSLQLQSLTNSISVHAQNLIYLREKGLPGSEKAKLQNELKLANSTLNQVIDREISLENISMKHLKEADLLLKKQLYYLTITVVAIISILALFLSVFISVRISRSIIQLEDVTQEIAKGDLHKRVHIESKDEIGKLAKSFNAMATALEISNRKRDEFVGMAAHDLRVPVSVIIEGASLLSTEALGALTPKQLRLAQMIAQASSSMMSLLDELLSVNSVNAKFIQLNPQKIDLHKFMIDTFDFYQLMAEKKHIDLRFNYLTEEKTAFLDKNKISQVVNNFVSNALKFSPAHSAVNMVIKKIGDNLRFEVYDQAGGIPEAEHNQIFTWFSKISVKPTGGEASHGLGLAICKDIIQAHKGDIGFKSEFGKGSVFYFEIEAFQEVPSYV